MFTFAIQKQLSQPPPLSARQPTVTVEEKNNKNEFRSSGKLSELGGVKKYIGMFLESLKQLRGYL